LSDIGFNQAGKARPALGRYPCGEETRQRIINAAVEIFGRQGFAGTSTRDIAVAADIKTPAIQYYFGSKLGLYDACIEQLTTAVALRITPEMERCRTMVSGGMPMDQIIAALCRVQDCLIDSFFDDYEGHAIQRLLAWEDVENTLSASEALMKERIGRPIFETFRMVVERAMASPALPSEVEIQAMALMGISMIFHVNHKRVLDLLNQPSFTEDFLHTLKQVAHRQTTYCVRGLANPPA
jgi:AcrR family transcriptional regulator